jgi:hypothetical protein
MQKQFFKHKRLLRSSERDERLSKLAYYKNKNKYLANKYGLNDWSETENDAAYSK